MKCIAEQSVAHQSSPFPRVSPSVIMPLRGASLAPHQRTIKDLHDLPSDLKNSLLEAPAFLLHPSYSGRSAEGREAAWSALASPTKKSTIPLGPTTTALPMPSAAAAQVRVFDYDGNLTTQQIGVNMFRFRSLVPFYFLRSQSWTVLITYSILMYIAIVWVVTAAYYLWGWACGGDRSLVGAIYFTVVSLAANGGYMGEDEETMMDPSHICYRGRTLIVMVCSYVNILFVGLVAALVVGKAEYAGKLGHRVVFSDLCTLTNVPGRVDQWRLAFRMANVDNLKPLAHGKLRLFCVTAEPLKEYRMRQQQRQWMKRNKLLVSGSGLGQSSRSDNGAKTVPLTDEVLRCCRNSDGHPSKGRQRNKRGSPASTKQQSAAVHRCRRHHRPHRSHRHSSSGSPPQHQSPPHERSGRGNGDGDGDGSGTHAPHEAVAHSPSRSSSTSSSPQERKQQGSRANTQSCLESRPHVKSPTKSSGAEASDSDMDSDKTNSSVSVRTNDKLYAASPSVGVVDTFNAAVRPPHCRAGVSKAATRPGVIQGYGTLGPDSATAAQEEAMPAKEEKDEEEEEASMERAYLRVQEMRWTCAEETYLDHGSSGQLSLWYPATILHTIDERSPLFSFMELPNIASALGSATVMSESQAGRAGRNGSSPWNRTDDGLSASSAYRFQIVAVFDATDMDSGATIMTKHTYTTIDIATHFKFSDKLVYIQPESSEVLLDYHYFNALLPIDLVEPSTTDTDA